MRRGRQGGEGRTLLPFPPRVRSPASTVYSAIPTCTNAAILTLARASRGGEEEGGQGGISAGDMVVVHTCRPYAMIASRSPFFQPHTTHIRCTHIAHTWILFVLFGSAGRSRKASHHRTHPSLNPSRLPGGTGTSLRLCFSASPPLSRPIARAAPLVRLVWRRLPTAPVGCPAGHWMVTGIDLRVYWP